MTQRKRRRKEEDRFIRRNIFSVPRFFPLYFSPGEFISHGRREKGSFGLYQKTSFRVRPPEENVLGYVFPFSSSSSDGHASGENTISPVSKKIYTFYTKKKKQLVPLRIVFWGTHFIFVAEKRGRSFLSLDGKGP